VSSFSCYHRDVISLAELAKQREATVLAITDFELSPLTKIADACIYLPGMGDNFRVSIGPTFVIAQHLVNEVAAAKGMEAPHLQPPELTLGCTRLFGDGGVGFARIFDAILVQITENGDGQAKYIDLWLAVLRTTGLRANSPVSYLTALSRAQMFMRIHILRRRSSFDIRRDRRDRQIWPMAGDRASPVRIPRARR
jgi:SIS domain-containing protein